MSNKILGNLSIAIVTKNRETALLNLFSTIKNQPNIKEVKNIFVFENQVRSLSVEQKRKLKKDFANISFHFSKLKKVENRNLALKMCETRYLAFLDDDVTLSKKWLLTVEKSLKNKHDQTVFIQGSYREFYIDNVFVRTQELVREYESFSGNSSTKLKPSVLPFALDTKNVILDLDFLKLKKIEFKPIYNRFGFCEDTDFGYSVYKRGGQGEYKADLEVIHHKQVTATTFFHLAEWSARSYGIFCKANGLKLNFLSEVLMTLKLLKFAFSKEKFNKTKILFLVLTYRIITVWYLFLTYYLFSKGSD